VLWESFDLGPEDILWTGINFMGGFSGQQEAPCGALSAGVHGVLGTPYLIMGRGAGQQFGEIEGTSIKL